MDVRDLKAKMRELGLTVREGDLEERVRACMEAVRLCVRPVSLGDRTCLRKIRDWAIELCRSGIHCPEELLPRIIDQALEASRPECRNPRAVFMYLMKTELHYAA